MNRNFRLAAMAAVLVTLGLSGRVVLAAQELPAVQHSGAVAYINGGVGELQAKAMEKAGADWPLMIVYAKDTKPRNEFIANANTVIRNAKGVAVLKVDGAGPIVLAKLEPGNYTVEATHDGKAVHRKVDIKKGGHQQIEMLWQ